MYDMDCQLKGVLLLMSFFNHSAFIFVCIEKSDIMYHWAIVGQDARHSFVVRVYAYDVMEHQIDPS